MICELKNLKWCYLLVDGIWALFYFFVGTIWAVLYPPTTVIEWVILISMAVGAIMLLYAQARDMADAVQEAVKYKGGD